MSQNTFSMFPNERFIDLNIYQFGYEQCSPLHSFGPFVRNHYLFHYIISGKGTLLSTYQNQLREYKLEKEEDIKETINKLTEEMLEFASKMEFEQAAEIRDKIKELEKLI
mgnify:CR=1 FL=1